MRSWILRGSPENHAATLEQGFEVIGLEQIHQIRPISEHDAALPGERLAAAGARA